MTEPRTKSHLYIFRR